MQDNQDNQDNFKDMEPPLVTIIKDQIAASAAEHARRAAQDPAGEVARPRVPELDEKDSRP